MGDKIITNCPNCGKTLCKIGNDSNVEIVCKHCKKKYEVRNDNGLLTIMPVDKVLKNSKLVLVNE